MVGGNAGEPRPVPVICGPTGAGKSRLAMALAERVAVASPEAPALTIISADSRQLYRGFDIGTAKPTVAEQRLVPHVGVDVADPTERWSAWQWADLARAAIQEARRLGREPVVVGGTGFYLRALAAPLATVPPLDAARREALGAWLDALPRETLREWCARLDPPRAALGPVQWHRAVEVALLTGHPLSTWYRTPVSRDGEAAEGEAAPVTPVPVRYLVVDPGPSLSQRIADRVHEMVAGGWLAEVERLMAEVPASAAAWQATGYGALREHLEGRCSRDAAIARVIVETRQYAKRQRTWFRHQLREGPVTRISPVDPAAVDRALAWWRASPEDLT